MRVFDHEQAAARFLLSEATTFLAHHRVKFVVVGGWAPFLLHSPRYGHPGTFDVDVLLDECSLEDGSFERVAEAMLAAGYLRAAKNMFQVHKVLLVGAEDIIFHVDFLNEKNPGDTLEVICGSGRVRSIYTPTMRAVFEYGTPRSVPGDDLRFVTVPAAETFIATKAPAALVAKRTRDAFDIFVTAADQPIDQFAERWSGLIEKDDLFLGANDALWKAVYAGDAVLKIRQVLKQLEVPELSDREILAPFQFLRSPESGPR